MSPPERPRGRWRRTAGYLNWLFNPVHGLDAPGIYELLSTGSATEQGLYLNLGYWQRATSIDEASQDLARLVAGTARMGPGDSVLDCGFGFGDQDILWAQSFRPDRIAGLNITPSQVALARRRVAEAGLADRIDLREGSATAIPFALESFDVVVALECAFHFHTRVRFFQEAWRVLSPGGRRRWPISSPRSRRQLRPKAAVNPSPGGWLPRSSRSPPRMPTRVRSMRPSSPGAASTRCRWSRSARRSTPRCTAICGRTPHRCGACTLWPASPPGSPCSSTPMSSTAGWTTSWRPR